MNQDKSAKITKGNPALTKYLRLYIYSFVDLETTIKAISKLSKDERQNLKKSAIAREGKKFIVKLHDLYWREGLNRVDGVLQFYEKIKIGILVAQEVKIDILLL